MRIQHARREARFSGEELVLLEDQDRSLWDAQEIVAGRTALERALALRGRGPYVLQAAIASLQAEEWIDWNEVAALYGQLAQITHSPVVELNRAVAVAQAGQPSRRSRSSTASTSTTTSTCTPPAASCCVASAGPSKHAQRTNGR